MFVKRNLIHSILLIIILFVPVHVFAGWSPQEEIISGTWGSESLQFGLESGDTVTYDGFPGFFDISDDGWIVISDGVNGRFKLYGETGSFIRNITPPVANPREWVIEPKFVMANIVLILNKYYFFASTGEVITAVDGPGKIGFWGGREAKLYVEQRRPISQWLIYSPTGELLQTSSTRPLELGKVTVKRQSESMWNYEVEYPEGIYIYEGGEHMIKEDGIARINQNLIIQNRRDKVYAYKVREEITVAEGEKQKYRLDKVAEWVKPENQGAPPDIDISTIPPGVELPRGIIIAQYGEAVIGPDGSIYTWMRSETHYKILKWKWVE